LITTNFVTTNHAEAPPTNNAATNTKTGARATIRAFHPSINDKNPRDRAMCFPQKPNPHQCPPNQQLQPVSPKSFPNLNQQK
jgi:hypothetical protein